MSAVGSLPTGGPEIRQDVAGPEGSENPFDGGGAPEPPPPFRMEHFFRHEAGRIVSILAKIFGIGNLQLAEDVVQETLLEAFGKWSFGTVPDNPSAWVRTVAKRKVLNHL